jgi:hypothetical protein
VVDRDLVSDGDSEELPEIPLEDAAEVMPELEPEMIQAEPEVEPEPGLEPEPEIELEAAPEEPREEMSEAAFGEELLSLVDMAFGGADASPPEEVAAPVSGGGQQIVVSPLFKDFSVDELVAVIQGLSLLTFDPGDIVISEGEPGDSLYMLTTGSVKVLKKNASGKPVAVGTLAEGAFFGEGSILTGRPRTATVVATSRCELLELDRDTLNGIVQTHPHVQDVLKDFARDRARPKPATS